MHESSRARHPGRYDDVVRCRTVVRTIAVPQRFERKMRPQRRSAPDDLPRLAAFPADMRQLVIEDVNSIGALDLALLRRRGLGKAPSVTAGPRAN
jgi:hypothetical protein